MKAAKTFLKFILITLTALVITACSKTVQWEEEVPLNTGETIVVKRSGKYEYEYIANWGFGYKPIGPSTIDFEYKGKKYSHSEEIRLLLLAISPEDIPNLIASPFGWGNQNKFPCITPYYVQFVPDETGVKWQWAKQVEPWLFNLPTNLLIGTADINDNGNRLLPADRKNRNASILRDEQNSRIVSDLKPTTCVGYKNVR